MAEGAGSTAGASLSGIQTCRWRSDSDVGRVDFRQSGRNFPARWRDLRYRQRGVEEIAGPAGRSSLRAASGLVVTDARHLAAYRTAKPLRLRRLHKSGRIIRL